MRKRLTRKRLTMLVLAGLLVLGLAASASAWFTADATATVSGKTGNVSIRTWNVTLTDKFQPGDTQYVWLRVHNNGNCPVKITGVRIVGLPSYLGARFTKNPLNQIFRYCQSIYFKLLVHMPAGMTEPQNRPFRFQVKFHARNIPTAWPATGTGPS